MLRENDGLDVGFVIRLDTLCDMLAAKKRGGCSKRPMNMGHAGAARLLDETWILWHRYTREHVVTEHSQKSRSQCQQAYRAAWEQFYSAAHLETVLRRAHASGINIWSLRPILLWFSSAVPLENVHPLQAGIFRR